MDRELCDGGCRDLLVGQQTANTFSSDCANMKPLIWINVDPYRSLESASLVWEKLATPFGIRIKQENSSLS